MLLYVNGLVISEDKAAAVRHVLKFVETEVNSSAWLYLSNVILMAMELQRINLRL